MAIKRRWGTNRDSVLPPRGGDKGFTLVEILVVMGIIVLLLGLLVPAVTGISRSGNLNNAGRLVSNLLTIARSEAINRRTYVRVELLTQSTDFPTFNYRKLTLTRLVIPEATASPYYQQFTGWETLPDGVLLQPTDPNANASTPIRSYWLDPAQVSNTADTTTDALTYGGKSIPGSARTFLTFTPTGALRYDGINSTLPVWVRVVEGTSSAGGVSLINRDANGVAKNYFDLAVNALIGRTDVGRPEAPLP